MMFFFPIGYENMPTLDINNIRLEVAHNRTKIATFEPEKKSKCLQCDFCNEAVGEVYYYCNQHKKTYCFSCARNDNKKAVDFNETARCRGHLGLKDECTLNKIYLEDE